MSHSIMSGLKVPEDMFRNWTDDVVYMLRDFTDSVLGATFPQVIGREHRMLGLERWLDELLQMGVVFERLDRVAEQFLKGRSYGEYSPRQGKPR